MLHGHNFNRTFSGQAGECSDLKLKMGIIEEATDLLENKGLRTILEKYGTVLPTGSYALDLMTWRDLDLYLISDRLLSADFFSLGAEINTLLNPVKMFFRNELLGKTKGLPIGLYWGIYLGNERDGAWKIDLWCVSEEEAAKRHRFCIEIDKKLNPRNRPIIRELKERCWKNKHYRKTFYSTDIYDAVFEHGISTFEGLKNFINSKYEKQLIR